MNLKQLFQVHGKIEWRQISAERPVTRLLVDSREVEALFLNEKENIESSVYVAVRGHSIDGHQFIKEVCSFGPGAVVVEDASLVPKEYSGAVLEVLDSRWALQELSQVFYGHPGDRLLSFGVTGTNGKTSLCYILEFLLNQVNSPCGVLGTIDHHYLNTHWDSHLTTPGPLELQNRLLQFVELGAQSLAMEVSSHALKQKRIHQGFDVCIFTNLSRDHLDYHSSFEDYFSSKATLFSENYIKDPDQSWGIINGDDSWGRKLLKISKRQNLSFGQGDHCDVKFSEVQSDFYGSQFLLEGLTSQPLRIKSPLIGLHNVYNLVAALAALSRCSLAWQRTLKELPKFSGIPGRLQKVTGRKKVFGLVDYAHTDDALGKVLKNLKTMLVASGDKKLICVFGCGGDRDRGKRPLMAQAVEAHCDVIVVTSDNPRTESPRKIMDEITLGFSNDAIPKHFFENRIEAISQAVAISSEGDVILVAGKGHECFQEVMNKKIPMSDIKILKEALDGNLDS